MQRPFQFIGSEAQSLQEFKLSIKRFNTEHERWIVHVSSAAPPHSLVPSGWSHRENEQRRQSKYAYTFIRSERSVRIGIKELCMDTQIKRGCVGPDEVEAVSQTSL